MRIGIDTGGTFTDFVALVDGKFSVHKELSTPIDPSIAIYQGIKKLIGDKLDGTYIYHGTTIATNALLERKGSKIVLITTKGFEDIIEIGRQNRKELYNIFEQETKPLVERSYRVGIKERADFKGNILEQISKAEMLKLKNKIKKLKPEAIAISLINSYASSKNELIVENFQTDTKFDVIIMRHLLEHIEDPSAMLKKIQSFLKPEGLLIIIIPNIDSIGRYIFGENWEWILPWHLHFYTPRTLTMLVEKMGYKKMKCYQMPSPLWYPKSLGRLLKKRMENTLIS